MNAQQGDDDEDDDNHDNDKHYDYDAGKQYLEDDSDDGRSVDSINASYLTNNNADPLIRPALEN